MTPSDDGDDRPDVTAAGPLDPVHDPADPWATARASWRAQGADLGGRSPLLWYRDLPWGTLELTVAHPGGVAKLLAGHVTLLSELVRERVAHGQAHRRVSTIRRKTVELRREHGLSTCFATVGMATWPLRRAQVSPRAPVLLRECTIEPTDPGHRDFALRLSPLVVVNPVLEHYLRGEAGIDIDADELAALASRGTGFDPRPVYSALEERCASLPGFTLGPQMVLATFALAKLPFVAELATEDPGRPDAPLLGALAEAELASLLAGTGGDARADPPPDSPRGPPASLQVDGQIAPTVLDADSAQLAVLRDLAAGRSLVVLGRPGTGVTQTLANAAAQAVTRGETLLVVSEQEADLAALAGRLAACGAGGLVLPLRESPSYSAPLAEQLVAELDAQPADAPSDEGETVPDASAHLKVLQAHERAMHEPRAPWGVSLSRAQGELTRLGGLARAPHSRVRLEREVIRSVSLDDVEEVAAALVEAARLGAWERGRSEDPWYAATLDGEDDAEGAVARVQRLVTGGLDDCRARIAAVGKEAGLPEALTVEQWGTQLELMGRVRDTLDVFRPEVYEAPLADLVTATDRQHREVSVMARARGRRQARALLRPGRPPADLGAALRAASQERTEWEALAGRAARPVTPVGWEEASEVYESTADDLGWLADRLSATGAGKDLLTTHLDLLLERLLRLDARSDRAAVAARAHALLHPLRGRGLGPLVDDLARRGVTVDDVSAEVELVFWASVHDQVSAPAPSRPLHEELAEAAAACVEVERRRRELAVRQVRSAVHRAVARARAAYPGQEDALRAMARSRPVRLIEVLRCAPDLVGALRPVWAGSPLLVPATVPVGAVRDWVVLGQAQTLPAAHVAPSLQRGHRVLVTGDPEGVPGRPFVVAADSRAEDILPRRHTAASVLEVARAALPVRALALAYGVASPDLLRVDPAVFALPSTQRAAAVTHRAVGDPARVVEAAVAAVRRRAEQGGSAVLVLTADDTLAAEVETALRAGMVTAPDPVAASASVVAADRATGLVRDRVVLGLAPAGMLDPVVVRAALASARSAVHVLTDLEPQEWPDSPGLRLLLRVLAPTGGAKTDVEHHRSPVVADLALRLRAEGLHVTEGVGAGPYRIDLVVDDPARPGHPLLAVDTDAHPVGAVTDEVVRLRPQQLRRLGWEPARVWTTDVFRDPAREVARLVHLARQASVERG